MPLYMRLKVRLLRFTADIETDAGSFIKLM